MLNVINYYEQLVIDQLWQIAENSPEPFSQVFLEDVACLALNNLPTCYVRNMIDKSTNLTEMDHENMRMATQEAIAQAMMKVRLRSHEDRD